MRFNYVWEPVLAKLGPADRTLQPNQPEAALATSSSAVEKHTAELDRAIDYGKQLAEHFK